MPSFNGGQTFWIDPNLVQGATGIYLTALRLYFKTKPPADVNSSGLPKPGVSVFIVPTSDDGIPNVNPTSNYPTVYVPYELISISSDASQYTEFRWSTPVPIQTNRFYAFIMVFDRGAQFTLFKNKMGENLIGTTTPTPGASGTNSGRFFDYIGAPDDTTPGSEDWRPQNDVDLKYSLFGARFYKGGVSVALANTGLQVFTYTAEGNGVSYANGNYIVPPIEMEVMTFNQSLSIKESFIGPQMAYQNTFQWPGGSFGTNTAQKVACIQGNNIVVANTRTVTNALFSWVNVFNNYAGAKYLVVKNNDDVDIRRVEEILDVRTIRVDEPLTFTNSAATFYLTPVGKVSQFNKASPYGLSESFIILSGSSANSTLRFVNNVIEAVSIGAGGTGYNNNEILYFNGWEHVDGKVVGGYRGQANLQTNSSGGVTQIFVSNQGAGFINASQVTITVGNSSSTNTTSNTANGAGLTLTFTIGATVRLDQRPANSFREVKVVDLPISEMLPFFELDTVEGTNFSLALDTRYSINSDSSVSSGFVTYVDPEPNSGFFSLQMFDRTTLNYDKVPAFVSRSNEFVARYTNGAINDQLNVGYSSQVKLYINSISNNDFAHVFINTQPILLFSKYIINETYENEHTDQGAAWAKGMTRAIQLDKIVEDIVVFGTVYSPNNTDIQMYARIHNSQDPEAIDDKNWTRLELKDGLGLKSSSTDSMDYVQWRWGFQGHPNVELTFEGTAFTTNSTGGGGLVEGNNTPYLTGNGTTWSTNLTANLVAGDMIRIYPALFPNNSLIAIVNAVTNNTQLVLNNRIFGNSTFWQGNEFLNTPLLIDKITDFKQQAFNNYTNYNIVRYYNSALQEFDGYDTMQIKIVFVSDVPNKIPRVDDIEVIASSP